MSLQKSSVWIYIDTRYLYKNNEAKTYVKDVQKIQKLHSKDYIDIIAKNDGIDINFQKESPQNIHLVKVWDSSIFA